jgi:hypothetical protein
MHAWSVSMFREQKVVSLMDAIRKSSLMPAQRPESMSTQMCGGVRHVVCDGRL